MITILIVVCTMEQQYVQMEACTDNGPCSIVKHIATLEAAVRDLTRDHVSTKSQTVTNIRTTCVHIVFICCGDKRTVANSVVFASTVHSYES